MNSKVLNLKCSDASCDVLFTDKDVEDVLRNTGIKEYD
jgi:hypothetical protein